MTRFASWIIVAALLTAFGGVTYHVVRQRAESGKDMPEYSAYSKEDNGLAAAALFLRNAGWEPVALSRPIQHTHYRGFLILVQPQGYSFLPGQESDVSEPDARSLVRWVEQGNTLLLCGRGMDTLHEQLGVSLRHDRATSREMTITPAEVGEAGRYTDRVDRIGVEGHDTLQASTGVSLWSLGEQPAAVLLRRGQGRVFIVADPSLLTHRGLDRPDTKVFLHDLVAAHVPQGGKVYFDEYHHGLHSGGGFWGYLRYHGQQWAVLPALLVIAAAAWALAIRLGPATPTPPPKSADAVEYASALARIYERAGVRQLLAQSLVRGFLAELTRHLRLRRSALPAEILAAWRRQRPRQRADELESLLRGVGELRRGDTSVRQLLLWAGAFDQFQNEVLRARQ